MLRNIRFLPLISILIIAFNYPALCQVNTFSKFSLENGRVDYLSYQVGGRTPPVQFPDTVPKTNLSKKSPLTAVVLSGLLPGAGQVYAERYWKIPVIYGFGAWFAINWRKADDLYLQYRSEYGESLVGGSFAGQGDERLRSIRDFYRNERDRFALYIALTYLLNVVDAYVGASLYNFDVSEDLAGESMVRMKISLPLR